LVVGQPQKGSGGGATTPEAFWGALAIPDFSSGRPPSFQFFFYI
jgi:hypothetical protein